MAPKAVGKSKSKHSRKRAPNRLEHLNTVPDVLDVAIALPHKDDGIEIRCVSTDKLADIRITLSEHPDACHLTNFVFANASRGDELKDDTEVVSLKPCAVALKEATYDKASALGHLRRFLDLLTCTNLLGPCQKRKPKPVNSWLCDAKGGNAKISSLTPSKLKESNDHGNMWEEPLLDEFYAYFSLSKLEKPVAGVEVQDSDEEGAFFALRVNLGQGRNMLVHACAAGFYAEGKREVCSTSLIGLLRGSSEGFGERYAMVMDGFRRHNQFGNPPVGLRGNTWAVPPCLAQEGARRALFPSDDMKIGGSMGGFLSNKPRNWWQEFAANAAMSGHSPADRVARDRKVFLLHSHFADTAITTAAKLYSQGSLGRSARVEECNLVLSSQKEPSDLTVDCGVHAGLSDGERFSSSEKSLLKGLMADENTIARDFEQLARVKIHFDGSSIEVNAKVDAPELEPYTMEDEPASKHYEVQSLNVHGLRVFCNAERSKSKPSTGLLREVISGAMVTGDVTPPLLRWEIVSSWVQQIKNPPLEGPGSLPQKAFGINRRLLFSQDFRFASAEGERQLREKLGNEKWNDLAKLNIGLHRKGIARLLAEANKYYAEIAIPRIIHDFGSLELSPVDGQTLTDFMHSRGINMRHIGRLAVLSSSLTHIYRLCIQEMITRAMKRVMRAIMSRCSSMAEKADSIAAALDALLGPAGAPMSSELWDWIHAFVKRRFDFDLPKGTRAEIRHLALLRDLAGRVGIEVASKRYDFSCAHPFKATDVVSLFPVCKYIQFASADGRQLLEQAKSALDKGKLDEAVTASTSALSKMCSVCGSNNRTTASAFSLLAVVLYHTGDFLQAAIYQQKALAVNEREYGLDHPDTIKSYGDLAVFFYRLQHTKLALHYVSRALYLLHLTCGANHPNTAATYINVAMMEEGLGNIHVALRYLQEALHCNQRLLGPDHVQTAASYHAIAIALSLMDPPLYTLSVQHEQTTLDIMEQKLGPDDLRTQDAAAWLEYFDMKANEAQEAAKSGATKPDCNIACKGHLPVKDLMKFILDDHPGEDRPQSKTPDSTLYNLSSSNSCGEEASRSSSESDCISVSSEDSQSEIGLDLNSNAADSVEGEREGDRGLGQSGLLEQARREDSTRIDKLNRELQSSQQSSRMSEEEDQGEWVCVSNRSRRDSKDSGGRNKRSSIRRANGARQIGYSKGGKGKPGSNGSAQRSGTKVQQQAKGHHVAPPPRPQAPIEADAGKKREVQNDAPMLNISPEEWPAPSAVTSGDSGKRSYARSKQPQEEPKPALQANAVAFYPRKFNPNAAAFVPHSRSNGGGQEKGGAVPYIMPRSSHIQGATQNPLLA